MVKKKKYSSQLIQRGYKSYRNKRAFNLIEILLALTIVSVVLTTLYVSFSNSMAVIKNSSQRAYWSRKMSILYKIIERDLQNIFYTQDEKMRYFVLSQDSISESDRSRIDFISSFPQMSSFAPNSAIRELSYFLREGKINALGVPTYQLLRREQLGVDKEPNKGGSLTVLADQVLSLKIDVSMGLNRWNDKWNYSLQKVYPTAVRVQIKFSNKEIPPDFRDMTIIGILKQDKPK